MPLLNLPTELLTIIASHVELNRDLNALIRTCRYLHSILNDALYHDIAEAPALFCWAIKHEPNLISVLHRFITVGKIDPNSPEIRRSALACAAKRGRLDIVKLLIAHGVDPNTSERTRPEDRFGHDGRQTPLFWAAQCGHESIVRYLLELGVNQEVQNSSGRTAFVEAVEAGHQAIVELLLDYEKQERNKMWMEEGLVDYHLGCMVPADDGQLPLSFAAEKGHVGLVRLLLKEAPAHLNMKDDHYSRTALMRATMGGHEEVVRILIEAGADVHHSTTNFRRETALVFAAEKGFVGIAKLILAADTAAAWAEIGSRPGLGRTEIQANEVRAALSQAAEIGHLELVQILLAVYSGFESMKIAVNVAFHRGHAAVLAYLLDQQDALHMKEYHEKGLLGCAVRSHRVALVNLLLERNLLPEKDHDENGFNPLSYCIMFGDMEVLDLVLRAGTSHRPPNYKSDLQQGLVRAMQRGNKDLVARLIQAGASPTAPDGAGITPLSAGVRQPGTEEVVQYLIVEHNVDVNTLNQDGSSALTSAAMSGRGDAVRILLQHSADPNWRSQHGFTPLGWAAHLGAVDTVVALLEDGTPPETWRYPPSCLGIEEEEEDNQKIPRARYFEYIDTPDDYGRTPLLLATMRGHEDIVRLLLARGSNAIYTSSCAGSTPMSFAARYRGRARAVTHDYKLQYISQWLQCQSYVTIDLKQAEEAEQKFRKEGITEYRTCESCTILLSRYADFFMCSDPDDSEFWFCQECVAKGKQCKDLEHSLVRAVWDENGNPVPMSEDEVRQHYGAF